MEFKHEEFRTVSEIECFDQSVALFVSTMEEFSSNNIGPIETGNDEIMLQKATEISSALFADTSEYYSVPIFMQHPGIIWNKLAEVIDKFVVIFETGMEGIQFCEKDKQFIQAMKCVNNIRKHGYRNFDISGLIYPIPIVNINTNRVEFIVQWQPLPLPFLSDKTKECLKLKKIAYEQYLEGKNVEETIEIAQRLVKEYSKKASEIQKVEKIKV